MDYGNLLGRAWELIWNNKFLIGLGILATFASGSSGSPNFRFPSTTPSGGARPGPGPGGLPSGQDFANAFKGLEAQMAAAMAIVVAIVCVALIIGLALWVVGRIAEGGLIGGANELESGRPSSFTQAWGMGWNRGVTMVLIGLVAAIPSVIFVIIVLFMLYGLFTSPSGRLLLDALSSNNPNEIARAFQDTSTFWMIFIAVCCPFTLVSWALQAIRVFADRACITENKGVMESYGRGFQVLRDNFGQAFILFLIQVGLGIGLGILLALPTFLIALCCLLWPVLWIINGTIQAYFGTLWTLAWRQWVGAGKDMGEPMNPATVSLG